MKHPPSNSVHLRVAELHREDLYVEAARERLLLHAADPPVIERVNAAFAQLPRGVIALVRGIRARYSCSGRRPPLQPPGESAIPHVPQGGDS